MSIFYDWNDDGSDRTKGEQNFGVVHHSYNNASLPRAPKLAYDAARVLNQLAGRLPFKVRLPASNVTAAGTVQRDFDTYALSFDAGHGQEVLAVWKVSEEREGSTRAKAKTLASRGAGREAQVTHARSAGVGDQQLLGCATRLAHCLRPQRYR